MLIDIILGLALIICLITDLKDRKIYNKVIFPSLVVTVVLQVAYHGLGGLKSWALGFIIGLSILLVPYFLKGMGAGDVKLLALIGAAKGTIFVLNTAIYMALLGGVIALLVIIFQKQVVIFIKILFSWIVSFFGGARYKLEIPKYLFSKKYPYGVAIVGGAVICLLFKGAWII